jgi:predicted DNA-binding transcriptional regulator AlpA
MTSAPRHPFRDVPRLAVRDTTAAAMLDMPAAEFRRLVERGALPKPIRIGEHDRWPVAQIEAIITGKAALPSEDFDL